MIEYKVGDILTEHVEALVNTVNCVGIMGRGVALQFKKAFPENFAAYAEACQRKEVQPGHPFIFETGQMYPRYIINLPTKRHWRGKSRMEDIEVGLAALAEQIRARRIRSIALPPLGSGLGGLDWSQVRSRIEATLRAFPDLKAVVFKPGGGPTDSRVNRSTDVPKMTTGRAVLVGLMHRYLDGLLDPFVTLLEVHKLMYFQQEAGEYLRLRYHKAPYGPYAESLRHVLHTVEGHFLFGYADGGDNPGKPLELVPGAIEDATAVLACHPRTRARFDKVADLVAGFESSFGLELLSTIHWVATREEAHSLDDVVTRTYAWNARKRQFSRRQIELALDRLSAKDWIHKSQR